MPKDKSSSYHRNSQSGGYSYRPYPSTDVETAAWSGKSSIEAALVGRKDWEDVMCPVCMETPHNAVLLQCSSYDKGCRPYMCDTSYRHSNCLDQYLKANLAGRKSGSDQPGFDVIVSSLRDGDPVDINTTEQDMSHQSSASSLLENATQQQVLQRMGTVGVQRISEGDLQGLTCPLCRGHVQGCEVVKGTRDDLNRKARVCAREACSFSGSYEELRVHARREHPFARPAEIDPARRRRWVQMERQRELGDVLSVIQASMPHATISGDYAVDGENDSLGNVERNFLYEEGHLLPIFLSFQVFGSVNSFVGGRVLPPYRGVLRRHRRSGSSRQGLWGEMLHQSRNTESSAPVSHDPENEGFWERVRRHHHGM